MRGGRDQDEASKMFSWWRNFGNKMKVVRNMCMWKFRGQGREREGVHTDTGWGAT